MQHDLLGAELCVWPVQGIRVNGVNPATVNTNFHTTAGLSEEVKDKYYEAGENTTLSSLPLPCTHSSLAAEGMSWNIGEGMMLQASTAAAKDKLIF